MRFKTVFLTLLLLGCSTPLFAQLKKVRFSVSAASIAGLPFRMAQLKGFYREEGLDVEVIFIRGAVGMQALLGGSVDFASASGSTIATALQGRFGYSYRQDAKTLSLKRKVFLQTFAP